jgi:general nucleoside transport system permease protein
MTPGLLGAATSFSIEDLGAAIGIAFTYFTIIYLTGLGGLYSERSGIVNIGLEGMMIIGTVVGSAGAHYFTLDAPDGFGLGVPLGPVLGILLGAAAGALFASIHALATVTFRVDHIVSGVVINLVAVGLARFLSTIFFGQATQSDSGQPHMRAIDIPLLADIPGIGRAFQRLSPFVIVAALLVVPVWFSLYRTRWGLRLRACGENPDAARSLGVRVAPLRYQGVLLSGTLAGMSGAFLAVEVNLSWNEGQTQGLGFIALAALILSNWNPVRLMLAAFVFGIAQAVPLRLSNAPFIDLIPPEFIRMTPYVVTIVVLAGFVGKVRPPEAAGRAYEAAGGT